MKHMATSVLALLMVTAANAAKVSPIEQVVTMLSDLEAKILGEGQAGQKVYEEFSEWCEDRSRNVGFEIKTGKSQVQELNAAIDKETATAESLTAKIEELTSAISVDEADLKAATTIRAKEEASFNANQAELTEVIGTLQRAISILEKEMAKSGSSASMMQLKSANNVAQALSVMVDAMSLSSADASKLQSFMQNSEEDDQEPGAPAGAVFKSSSGGIVATLQELYEKAEAQLAEARSTETQNVQAYQMLHQSLEDEIKYGNQDLDKAKKGLAGSQEAKATAEGDLSVTSKDLDEDVATLSTLHADCMKGAEDFEAETKSRGEELKALAEAKKVIKETTSGAADLSYSFLQVSRSSLSSAADLANFEAVRFVRDLSEKLKAPVLAQLASRMAAAMRMGGQDADPFGKVKGLISDLIERLEAEGEADATEKAYCDKEMAYTENKKADKEATISKLSTSIDSMSAKSAKLKSHVAELQKELASLARSQAEADKLRSEEHAIYETDSAEMEQGIKGVQQALKVLRDYYASDGKEHGAAEGAGEGIIGLLEVVESDFSKGLAEMKADESDAESDHDKLTKTNEITKATKDQSVKYKTKEFKGLDKQVAEATADRSTVQTELDAVNEYYASLQGRCVAKAETYAERTQRRSAEIAGLKQALQILDGEAVLIQQTTNRKLRGHH
jgi:chromosome segregation ATPase